MDRRGYPWYIGAWTDGVNVWVRPWARRYLFAVARAAHELWHILDMSREHEPWWTFDLRSLNPVRLRWGRYAYLRTQARGLLRHGITELPELELSTLTEAKPNP